MKNGLRLDDWLIKRLASDPQEAAELLRVALAEATEDPQGLVLTVHYVITARGGFDELGLTLAEVMALLNALGKTVKPEVLAQTAQPLAA